MMEPHSYDRYMVSEVRFLQPIDREVVALLYQPIIGSVAHSLFTTLWGEVSPSSCERMNQHDWLLTTLNIDGRQFVRARRQLEAIGLLKTYVMEDGQSRTFIYELQEPASPTQFFNDDVCLLLLLDCVGELRLKQLREHFQPKKQIPSSYEEITTDFNEVYHLSDWHYRHSQSIIAETKQDYPKSEYQPIHYQSNIAFSEEIFEDSLPHELSSEEKEDLVSMAKQLSELYGYNELEIAEFASLAIDDNLHIDKGKWQSIAIQAYEMDQPKRIAETHSWDKESFSIAEQKVLTLAEEKAPLEFIKLIKQQQQGIVTTDERYMIQNTANRSVPDMMVNIVVYYLLIGNHYTALPRKQFEGMLNIISQMCGQNPSLDLGTIYRKMPSIEESAKHGQSVPTITKVHTLEEWQQRGLTLNTAKLFEQAEKLSPLQFLKQTKQHYNAIITDKETWRLTQIQAQQLLPDSVINLIIYRCIQHHEQHELTAKFDRISNQISQKWQEQSTLIDVWEWLTPLLDENQISKTVIKKKQGVQPAWEEEKMDDHVDEVKQKELAERLNRLDQL